MSLRTMLYLWGEGGGEARLRRELARKTEQVERLERAKTAAELRAAAQKELVRPLRPPSPRVPWWQRGRTGWREWICVGRRLRAASH